MPTLENGYWRCKSGKHLWVNKEDAWYCCRDNYSRVLTTIDDIKPGERTNPSSLPGFVFVWRN